MLSARSSARSAASPTCRSGRWPTSRTCRTRTSASSNGGCTSRPSVSCNRSAARLDLSAETLLAQAGVLDPDDDEPVDAISTESAIRRDAQLTDDQKQALLVVYRSYVQANSASH